MELAYEVAMRFRKRVKYREEAGIILLDLTQIARVLVFTDDKGMYQRWEHYTHHFATAESRRTIFTNIDDVG